MVNRRRLLLGRSFVLLLGIRLGLALLSFQRLRKGLVQISRVTSYTQQKLPRDIDDTNRVVRQVVWAVEKSAQLMPGGAKCLAKALATQVLLARRGCEGELKIGVAKNDQGQLEAHAWIVKDQQVIMGKLPNLERFTSLPSIENLPVRAARTKEAVD